MRTSKHATYLPLTLERGIPATHGGTYTDPITGKPSQFDIRAEMLCHKQCGFSFSIECKGLAEDCPLVVSRVPRPAEDSFHEVVKSSGRKSMGESFITSMR